MKYLLLYILITLQLITITIVLVSNQNILKVDRPQCGDFQYYDEEFDKCMTFRNYEQEARYNGIIE